MVNYGETPEDYNPPNDQHDMSSQLGYVRYDKDQMDMDEENNRYAAIDRNQLADTITRMIMRYDGMDDVATLVTDEEVLVAYTKPDELDRNRGADIVRKTALSITPRFYDVYVSDQTSTFRDIESLKNSSTQSDDYDNSLNSIIEEMKEAPQGEPTDEEKSETKNQNQ